MSSEPPIDADASPPTRRIRLVIAYHGAMYHGWQIQTSDRTVEGTVTDAVAELYQRRRKVWGASRTDAGVHALGQVAAFDDHGERSITEIYRGLNHFTPDDIWIRSVDVVPMAFHPRHSARGKIYEYRIEMGRFRDPFLRDRAMHVRKPLDVAEMHAAAQHLIGEHDFTSFRAKGCAANSPVRELREVSVTQVGEREVLIRVVGTAFLKYMVRAIVGTLVKVGRGHHQAAWVGEVLAARDRARAGSTVVPEGLTLVEVFHPDFPIENPA